MQNGWIYCLARSYGLLHFPNIEFKSGGTFKLCFCDHTRLDGPCAKAEDFAIEVPCARLLQNGERSWSVPRSGRSTRRA